MKKLSLLLKPIDWIAKNPLDAALLTVFNMSVIPFVWNKQDYGYGMYGFLITFCVCIAEHLILNRKPSKLHNIVVIVFLIVGLASVFIIVDKPYQRQWLPYENCLATYLGAFMGIMCSHFIISFVDNERKERKAIEKTMDEQLKIVQKEKAGYVAIKKQGKLIGFIEQSKYDEFVKNNIEQ